MEIRTILYILYYKKKDESVVKPDFPNCKIKIQ